MFSYQIFCNRVRKHSEEKLKAIVYANWFGNTIIALVIALILSDFMSMLYIYSKNTIFLLFYWIIFSSFILYLSTRKAGVGITNNRIVYVRFRHFGYKPSRVFEIPFDKIKSITVSKILYMRFVKISFISDVGKLEKIKFLFNSFFLGFNMIEYKKNSNEVFNKLVEIQKIVDKGDF